jgi:DNA polymerase III gamma/tau subunit
MEDVIEIKATSNTKVNLVKDIKDGLKDSQSNRRRKTAYSPHT